ncbi:hypothetical protein [Bacillus cereus]|uniref:YgiT-type zinc finger protein n=1 Tax=Bacillus cereus TaxID=1396 RepID=A0A161T9E5_BACCE|nr:hypothetical protein [Bacillus cereus]KZD71227.1 hypothetical protein B4088_0957 [Bacillus cereus]
MKKRMMQTCCKECKSGTYKLWKISLTVKTRHVQRALIPIENVPVYKCTICGHQEMSEQAKMLVSVVQKSNLRAMQELAIQSHMESFESMESFEKQMVPMSLGKIKKMFMAK